MYMYFSAFFTTVHAMCTCHKSVIIHVSKCFRFGPLVCYWCMRFEGKHNYFKDLAHRVKCFKNIPKTMASQHQRMMCYHLNSGFSPYSKQNNYGPGIFHLCYWYILRL